MQGEYRPTRRVFLKGYAGGATGTVVAGLTGCVSLNGGQNQHRNEVPGLYDLGSPVSTARGPIALGVRDVITYVNFNELAPRWINHEWVNPALGYNTLQQFPNDYDPPAVVGYDTAKTELLSRRVTRREIVFISASYHAALHDRETPYNFFTNLDYTSQARVHLKWIAETVPGATVAFIFPDNRFGRSPVKGATQYARSLNLNVADDIILPVGATSAISQLEAAKGNDVDYLIHQNNAAAMETVMRDKRAVYPEVTVCGLTWTVDERHIQQSSDVFQGARYVNTFKTFDEAISSATKGRTAIKAAYEREDRSLDDVTVANLHYVRGVIQALILVRAFNHTADMGLGIFQGKNLRKGMLDVEGWDAWGLSEPVTFKEGDRRATLTGRLYEITNGEFNHDRNINLPRKDKWLGI